MTMRRVPICLLLATGCGGGGVGGGDVHSDSLVVAPVPAADPLPMADLAAAEILGLNQAWRGDYNELGERRFLRALVPYNLTLYYIDGAEQRGAAFETLRELEKTLPTVPGQSGPPKIVIIPTRRDRLLPALAAGYGDIAVGGFTITDERSETVDFSIPTISNIVHVPVTGPHQPPINREEDLSGLEVHVRTGSTYYDDLVALNGRLEARGIPPVKIHASDELLEDEDVLHMVDAGILPATLMRRNLAHFWAQHFDSLVVHDSVELRTHSAAGWALREGTPQLLAIVNGFLETHREGTSFGNVILRRYTGSVKRLSNPTSGAHRERFEQLSGMFRTYGERYNLDWQMLVAQGYQESRLDQSQRNPSGAVGIMQIKPESAADMGINDVFTAENNVHAGIKYHRWLIDNYFDDPAVDPLNRMLFALAAYNAGPGRVRQLRRKTAEAGLDPNLWFNNVEIMAARAIGREPVDYVGNIYKYYTAYRAIAALRGTAGP